MCLCVIDEILEPNTVIQEAWKCFKEDCLELEWKHRSNWDAPPPPIRGKWLQAEIREVIMLDPPPKVNEDQRRAWFNKHRKTKPTYESGFHVFAHKSDAEAYGHKVQRVFVRDIRLIGQEYLRYTTLPPAGSVWVAREIFIP